MAYIQVHSKLHHVSLLGSLPHVWCALPPRSPADLPEALLMDLPHLHQVRSPPAGRPSPPLLRAFPVS